MAKKEKSSLSPLDLAIRNFSTQWFLIPQGTGIITVILHQLAYQFRGLQIIVDIFCVLTIVFLLAGLIAYGARIILYPKQVRTALSTDINETACLSSICITFTTIIQMIALTVVRDWSSKWGTVAFVLWWINVAMAVTCCIGLPYVFATIEAPGLDFVPPSILLPLIASLTAAAGGGVICRYGALSPQQQVPVIIVSYLLVGMGLPLSLAYDAVFLARCFDKKFPTGHPTDQMFLLCGPLGQGSFALQILGEAVARGSFAAYDSGVFLTEKAATPIAFASEAAGLMAWGFGTFWWGFAVIAVLHDSSNRAKAKGGLLKLEFSLTAWSIVFPWVGDRWCLRRIWVFDPQIG